MRVKSVSYTSKGSVTVVRVAKTTANRTISIFAFTQVEWNNGTIRATYACSVFQSGSFVICELQYPEIHLSMIPLGGQHDNQVPYPLTVPNSC